MLQLNRRITDNLTLQEIYVLVSLAKLSEIDLSSLGLSMFYALGSLVEENSVRTF